MKKYFGRVVLIFFIITSCNSVNCVKYKDHHLIIDKTEIQEIKLKFGKIYQRLKVDKHGIYKVEFYYSNSRVKNHLNTWITMNKQGGIIYDQSQFVDYRFFSKNKNAFLEIRIQSAYNPSDKFYLLYSDYDSDFNETKLKAEKFDFDEYGQLILKLKHANIGDNIIRAKIIREIKNGQKNVIYFEKELFVE